MDCLGVEPLRSLKATELGSGYKWNVLVARSWQAGYRFSPSRVDLTKVESRQLQGHIILFVALMMNHNKQPDFMFGSNSRCRGNELHFTV